MKNKLTLAWITGAALIGASSFAIAHPVHTDQDFDRMHTGMDANKDGIISRTEYVNYHGTHFDTWDTSRKGSLTREQVKTKMFEREMAKTDGNPQGNSPMPGSIQKK